MYRLLYFPLLSLLSSSYSLLEAHRDFYASFFALQVLSAKLQISSIAICNRSLKIACLLEFLVLVCSYMQACKNLLTLHLSTQFLILFSDGMTQSHCNIKFSKIKCIFQREKMCSGIFDCFFVKLTMIFCHKIPI